MKRWACTLAMLLAGMVLAVPGTQICTDLSAGDYDCTLTVEMGPAAAAASAVRVALEWAGGKPYLQVTVTKSTIEFISVANKVPTILSRIRTQFPVGKPCRLTLLRRGTAMGVMLDDRVVGRAAVGRMSGAEAGYLADAGWKVSDPRVQRIEPVVFSDDFMRSPEEKGSPWTIVSGSWKLKSAFDSITHGSGVSSWLASLSHDPANNEAANPFAWCGQNTGGKAGICTAGNTFWEDYTYAVAIQPGGEGACGVLTNITPAGVGLLVRWTSANSRKAGGNRLSLCRIRLSDGALTELAADAGGYVPGQWAKIAVVSSVDDLHVLVDGRERLTLRNPAPWRGAVGLYADTPETVTFDDVTVYGRTLDLDVLYETRQERLTQKFIEDKNGMKDWALRIGEWLPDAAAPLFRWFRQDLFGTHTWMLVNIKPAANTTGELWMTLNGDGKNIKSGFRAVLQLAGNPPRPTYSLFRDGALIGSKSYPPLTPNTDYALRLKHVENRVWLEVDNEVVIGAGKVAPLPGLHAAYRNEGTAFANVSGIQVLGYNTQDYPFTEAPTNWLAQGAWAPSIRWSCTPNWSFLAGWSRGDAVLWQKKRFSGDHSIEAYVGTKMEYPHETDIYYNRQGYFAVTLCGDGKDPRNGYAGVYGYPGPTGVPLQRAVLLRNGAVVAEMPIAARSWGANHRAWFYLQLNKRGKTVTFFARVGEEKYPLTFTDPAPLTEGIPAVWTCDNAMTVARVRLDYAVPPHPRTDPQVLIPSPDYPEWLDVNVPLSLDLSSSWAVSGRPVGWKVTPSAVPAGDEGAVTVAGGRLTFQPKQAGAHWYQVRAVDRAQPADQGFLSQPFHLSLPVYNPGLRRDDSHALVLYRFDEGQGAVLHDRSAVAPALDLQMTPDPANLCWIPGQGVRTRVGVRGMKSLRPADKLLAIRNTRACTFEVWASGETLYGASGGFGTYFAWEAADPVVPLPEVNLGFCYFTGNLLIATGGAPIKYDAPNCMAYGFRTSLHHQVVTWDGTKTTFYLDGAKLAELPTAWSPDKWAAGRSLFVANEQNGARAYSGSLYLLAIHDRCFTQAEITRHCQAGPSAK